MIDIFKKYWRSKIRKYCCRSSNALCQYDNNFLELPIPYRNENWGLLSKNTSQFLYGHDHIFSRCQSKKIGPQKSENIFAILVMQLSKAWLRHVLYSTRQSYLYPQINSHPKYCRV